MVNYFDSEIVLSLSAYFGKTRSEMDLVSVSVLPGNPCLQLILSSVKVDEWPPSWKEFSLGLPYEHYVTCPFIILDIFYFSF